MKQLILNSSVTSQLVVDYINSSNQVTNYALSITSIQLPALVHPPANYGDFSQAFAKARLDVLTWIDEVIPDFNQLPNAFINFNTLFQMQVTKILGDLTKLKSSPGDPQILASIKSDVQILVHQGNVCENTISDLDESISSYQSSIRPDAVVLGDLCAQITAAENIDETEIAKLNAVLANLQSIVDDRNVLVTLDTLENLFEGLFFVGVGTAIGCAFGGVPGVIIGTIFGIVTVGFTTYVPVGPNVDDEESLQDIQDDMDRVNNEIGMLNSTIGLLQNLNNQFSSIVSKSDEAGQNVKNVLAFWQDLQQDTAQIISELDDLLSAQSIDDAINDLQAAAKTWNTLDLVMQSIAKVTYHIDSNVYLAPSVPGPQE